MSVSTGFGTPSSSRGRGAGGARSTPAMRRICSTTSALTWMSGRQEGTKARPSSRPKPSRRRIASPSSRGISTPSSRFTSLYWKGTERRGVDGSPATIMRDGSPPQIERTSSVARSQPGTQKSGSTPRSNRYRASVVMPSFRPVCAIVVGSHSALSIRTSRVVSSQPECSPPMIPAINSTPFASAIATMLSSSA